VIGIQTVGALSVTDSGLVSSVCNDVQCVFSPKPDHLQRNASCLFTCLLA
jgi:hypothetical protein